MQILKEAIRVNIETSARKLFVLKGYEKTSMKEIALGAGVSKSNLYNYFASKECIFEKITHNIRDRLTEFSSMFQNHSFHAPFGSERFLEVLSDSIYEYLLCNREDFLLIMNSAVQSPYESVKEDTIIEMKNHFLRAFQYKSVMYDYYIVEVLTRNLLEGFIQIAKERSDSRLIKLDLQLLIRYHIKGIKPLLEKKL